MGHPATHADSSTELIGIARFTFHDGMVEEFKRVSAQCMDIVRTKDSGTLQYDTYISADETQALVIERYRDSAALVEHHANIGEEMMAAITATGTVVGELLGNPDAVLRSMLGGAPVALLALHMSL
jgi:quinol monooxygenase YgiN